MSPQTLLNYFIDLVAFYYTAPKEILAPLERFRNNLSSDIRKAEEVYFHGLFSEPHVKADVVWKRLKAIINVNQWRSSDEIFTEKKPIFGIPLTNAFDNLLIYLSISIYCCSHPRTFTGVDYIKTCIQSKALQRGGKRTTRTERPINQP